jgi:hypothetical protein
LERCRSRPARRGWHRAVKGITGGANAQAGATSHNFHRFSQEEFFSDLEFVAGTEVQARVLATVGLKPISGYEDRLLPWEGVPTSSQLAEVFRVDLGEQSQRPQREPERESREPLEHYQRALVDLEGKRTKLAGSLAQNLRPDNPQADPNRLDGAETRYDPMARMLLAGRGPDRRAPALGLPPNRRSQGRFLQLLGATPEVPSAYDLLHRNSALHAEVILRNVH